MKIAYFQCASGASGDMLIGSLLDAGVPLQYLNNNLKSLNINNYTLKKRQVSKNGFRATQFDVIIEKEQSIEARKWSQVYKIITTSELKDHIKEKALQVFKNLFEAESSVHGVSYRETHLHELAAVDCMVDIIGFLLSIDYLGLEFITFSPVNVGEGTVRTSHGILPVPAPATSQLLKGVPVYSSGISTELVTPTGAAIIKTIAGDFGSFPEMILEKTGYGSGTKELKEQPNITRVFIGKSGNPSGQLKLSIIETNIDDMNPQIYGHLIAKLLEGGANDAYLTPVIMKKGRPGIKLTVLAESCKMDALSEIIFEETTTIGIRYYEVSRKTLDRYTQPVSTKYGDIRVKIAIKEGEILNISPEYDECKRIADQSSVPLKEVLAETFRSINRTKFNC